MSAILDLWNSNFLTIGEVKRPILHQRTKFRKTSVQPLRRCRDLWFQDGDRRHLGFSKIQNFNSWFAARGQCASPCQISLKIGRTVAEIWRFIGVFSKWRPSAILDLLGAYWDHPCRPLDGLYRCAKFGENRCSSFDNMKLSRFCPFGLKRLLTPPKLWFLGVFHLQNGEQYQRYPQKAHPCASPRRLSHEAWKSVDGSDL